MPFFDPKAARQRHPLLTKLLYCGLGEDFAIFHHFFFEILPPEGSRALSKSRRNPKGDGRKGTGQKMS